MVRVNILLEVQLECEPAVRPHREQDALPPPIRPSLRCLDARGRAHWGTLAVAGQECHSDTGHAHTLPNLHAEQASGANGHSKSDAHTQLWLRCLLWPLRSATSETTLHAIITEPNLEKHFCALSPQKAVQSSADSNLAQETRTLPWRISFQPRLAGHPSASSCQAHVLSSCDPSFWWPCQPRVLHGINMRDLCSAATWAFTWPSVDSKKWVHIL